MGKTIEFERLEEAVKALNDSELSEKQIALDEGVDPNKLLAHFVDAAEAVPFEKEGKLPDVVVSLYNEISDEVTVAAATDECEMYGTGWNPKLKECKQCQEDYPNEFEKCKEMTQTQGVSETEVKEEEESINQQLEEGEIMAKKKEPKKGKEKETKKKEQPTKEVAQAEVVTKGNSEGKGKEVKEKGSPSNKFLVYTKWEESKGTEEVKDLHSFINERVKLSTIRFWVCQWKKGKDFPAGVKK